MSLFWWQTCYVIISHCIFTLILYQLAENIDNSNDYQTAMDLFEKNKNANASLESSVWCYGKDINERICKFRNLYYSPFLGEFIFFHGRATTVHEVPQDRCSPALLKLSSVRNHNLHYFNYQDAPLEALGKFNHVVNIHQPSLIFHRFNPSNIMHVFHDDLIPMFHTLQQHFQDVDNANEQFNMDVQLVFMDKEKEDPHFALYQLFSDRQPITSSILHSKGNQSLICFNQAIVGISKATAWYDYGFLKPQGEIVNSTVSSLILRQFTDFLSKKLEIESSIKRTNYVLLFSRESDRLILNELQLTFSIATTFNLQVIRVSLESKQLNEIIRLIKGSRGIIGMHGSILILSMFLPENSFLIELYPYAINPINYTPYRTLAKILGITYAAWQNVMKNKTITHPDRTREEGGIRHLDEVMQDKIMKTDEIPQHLCCEDPYWLFHIYQDTIVDTESFNYVMSDILDQMKFHETDNTERIKKFPGKVKKVLCKIPDNEKGVFVTWKPPWNIQFYQDVSYEVWFHDGENYMAYSLQNATQHVFSDNITPHTSYSIYVRGIIKDNKGTFSDPCHIVTK